jgi:hypothetical protein
MHAGCHPVSRRALPRRQHKHAPRPHTPTAPRALGRRSLGRCSRPSSAGGVVQAWAAGSSPPCTHHQGRRWEPRCRRALRRAADACSPPARSPQTRAACTRRRPWRPPGRGRPPRPRSAPAPPPARPAPQRRRRAACGWRGAHTDTVVAQPAAGGRGRVRGGAVGLCKTPPRDAAAPPPPPPAPPSLHPSLVLPEPPGRPAPAGPALVLRGRLQRQHQRHGDRARAHDRKVLGPVRLQRVCRPAGWGGGGQCYSGAAGSGPRRCSYLLLLLFIRLGRAGPARRCRRSGSCRS